MRERAVYVVGGAHWYGMRDLDFEDSHVAEVG